MKNVDNTGLLAWDKKSEFGFETEKIFKDKKFENLVDNDLYHLELVLNGYDTLLEIINEIIDKTGNEEQ